MFYNPLANYIIKNSESIRDFKLDDKSKVLFQNLIQFYFSKMFFLLGILVGGIIGYIFSFLDLQWFFNEILTVSNIQNKVKL